jgi:D-erythronate 2-dehydrogenase
VHILILGAAGMLGRKLAGRLQRDRTLGQDEISRLTLQDVVATAPCDDAGFAIESIACDLSAPDAPATLIAKRPQIIFHLAAVPSGDAEADFEKGYRVNVDATRQLFDAIRAAGDGYKPRIVFTSSIAVYGAPFHETIDDEFILTPLISYGAQKGICELLLADYSRRGFLDGIGIRLPMICVRPGRPNGAASAFFSSIIREPLNGEEALLPVPDDVRQWQATPRSAIDLMVHAASIDLQPLGWRRSLNMPGLSVSVGEQMEALKSIAGASVAARVRRAVNPSVTQLVRGWAPAFRTDRANALGFKTTETSVADIIRIHIEDELRGNFVR